MASFDKTRFSGLTPANRQKITGSQVLPETLLAFFKEQKELDAKTSIPDLILRAEEYHLIDSADSIDRTTVWRALKRDGVSTHRGKSSKQDRDSRRFAYPHRMDMILCDGKHFRAGAKRLKRVALFYLDDSTRKGLGVIVGPSESSELFLRGFYDVLLRYGLLRSVFLDNGSGFTADNCVAVAGQLNISFIYGTAGYPEGHGKIERFNQTVLNHVLRTLDGNPEVNADCDALQLRLQHYLFERYNHTSHEGIENQTPYDRFQHDTTALTFKENQAQ